MISINEKLESYEKNIYYNYVILAMIAVVSLGLRLTDNNIMFYIFSVLACFAIAFINPSIMLLGLLPLTFALHPFPQKIGIGEISFATLVFVILAKYLISKELKNSLFHLIKISKLFILASLIFIILNYSIAYSNNVTSVEWFRGLVPFLFITLAFPISASILNKKINIKIIAFCIMLTSFLYVSDVLYAFFLNALWLPKWKYFVGGVEHIANQNIVENFKDNTYFGPIIIRVTLLVVRSTDALLPLSLVFGFITSLLIKNKKLFFISLIFLSLTIYAVFATYTRSMILSCFIVLFLLAPFVIIYKANIVKKYLYLILFVIFISTTFLVYFQPNNIILGRFSKLFSSTQQMMQATSSNQMPTPVDDINVSIRAEEYRIAFDKFKESPIWGKGFGIKHTIFSEDLKGNPTSITVAYIHNWPLYVLMTGGILGMILYGFPIITGCIYSLFSMKKDFEGALIVGSGLAVIFIYSLFFAVFRFISFNIFLAIIYGYVLSQKSYDYKSK